MPTRRVFLVLGVMAISAPAALPQQLKMDTAEVHSDPDVDYSTFKTYGWKDPVVAVGNHATHMSIIWYVDSGLQKKGLRKIRDDDSEVPDLFVRYYAKGTSTIEGTPVATRDLLPGGPENLTTSFDLRKAHEGTLVLELQRASDDKAVWRAGSTFAIDDKRVDAEVNRAVDILLRTYPPKQ